MSKKLLRILFEPTVDEARNIGIIVVGLLLALTGLRMVLS